MKASKIYLVVAALITAMMPSCTEEKENRTPVLEIAQDCIEVPADGGAYSMDIQSDREWTVSCDREWCLVSPLNGIGDAVCEIRIDSSYLYTGREAHVTFSCAGRSRQVTVSQFGYEKVIIPDSTSIEVPDYEDWGLMVRKINVRSNISYDIIVEYQDLTRTGWLTVTKEKNQIQSIPRPGQLRISYSLYTQSDADRTARIILRQSDAPEGQTPIETSITVCQKHAQEIIPSREGDSLALITISRIMHIAESWDLSQPMIYWKNVELRDRTYFNEKLQKTVTEPRVVRASFSMFDTNEGIPYQIQFLDQLEELYFTANSNAHIKRIDLGSDVCKLEKLKVLSLVGYGISRLPEEMKNMSMLEELELSGNNLMTIPMDIISALDKQKLWYVNIGNNRRRDVFSKFYENRQVRDTLGLNGQLPPELFTLKNIRHIGLSYNYLEGSIPTMDYDASQYGTIQEKIDNNPVMPQLEQLSLNLNYMTGLIPDWILYHPNLRCWDPYTLVFNQYEYSRDSNGRKTGFSNEPSTIQQMCPLWGSNPDLIFDRVHTFDTNIMYTTLRHGNFTR